MLTSRSPADRPSKPYFLITLKWSVLQFVIEKPLESIASIITNVGFPSLKSLRSFTTLNAFGSEQAFGVYCPSSYSPEFANVYISTVDFISVSWVFN